VSGRRNKTNRPHPSRSPAILLADTDIAQFNKTTQLNTKVVDFLLQKSLPVVGTSNSLSLMELFLNKIKSTDRSQIQSANKIKDNYLYYSTKHFHYIGINCNHNHFCVVQVGFDINKPEKFDSVKVFDSLRKSGRTTYKGFRNTAGAYYLKKFQSFLLNYVFNNIPEASVLKEDSEYILKNADYYANPPQTNHYDCGLFALASVLHLVKGRELNSLSYSQDNITDLRDSLLTIFSNNNQEQYPDLFTNLTGTFIYSFFPYLSEDEPDDP
jgi:Ulp1 protease family, C-terminal catalytic domain